MITIKPTITDIKEDQRGQLPQNAVKLNTPSSMFAVMLIKTLISNTRSVSFPAIIIGFLMGVILLAVHEWLHAVCYPKDAKVTIGKVKGKLLFLRFRRLKTEY